MNFPDAASPMRLSRALLADYSAMAAEYARHWAPVIQPMGRCILGELPLATARRVLDLGTGTGSGLPELAASAPQAQLVGVDGSEGMLRIAQRGASHPLALMDAGRLGLRSETIDVAVMVFVLFHAPDHAAALREVRRILKPGGAIGVVTWGKDPGVPGVSIWTAELDAQGAAADDRDPSLMQHARMDTPAKLAALLETAGFTSVRAWSTEFEHRWTVERLIALHSGCGMPWRRAQSLPEAARKLCRSRVEVRLATLGAEQLVYRPEVVFAVGH